MGRGASFTTGGAAVGKGSAFVTTRVMGNVTARSTLTYGLELSGLAEKAESGTNSVPVQVQLRYTRPSGEQVLQVLTAHQAICASREKAEEDINGTGIALFGIHA